MTQFFALLILFWGLSVLGTWYLTKNNFFKTATYPLLSPMIEQQSLDTPEKRQAVLFTNLLPLKELILGFVGEEKSNVAFYVEDLNSGTWTGWQEREPFIGASLLKVPIAVGVMKKVDKGDWTLETKFKMEDRYKDKYYGELYKTPTGTEVTVDSLMKEMIQNSDNTAANLFFDKLTLDERDDVYYFIGVKNPEVSVNNKTGRPSFSKISAKELATMFRALYNSTYLTRKSSSYILGLLSETRFDDMISTEIPKEITVAHKIGNFFNADPKRPKQYHDCGLVYIPNHPYLYCVMTNNFSNVMAKDNITSISSQIFSYFYGKDK